MAVRISKGIEECCKQIVKQAKIHGLEVCLEKSMTLIPLTDARQNNTIYLDREDLYEKVVSALAQDLVVPGGVRPLIFVVEDKSEALALSVSLNTISLAAGAAKGAKLGSPLIRKPDAAYVCQKRIKAFQHNKEQSQGSRSNKVPHELSAKMCDGDNCSTGVRCAYKEMKRVLSSGRITFQIYTEELYIKALRTKLIPLRAIVFGAEPETTLFRRHVLLSLQETDFLNYSRFSYSFCGGNNKYKKAKKLALRFESVSRALFDNLYSSKVDQPNAALSLVELLTLAKNINESTDGKLLNQYAWQTLHKKLLASIPRILEYDTPFGNIDVDKSRRVVVLHIKAPIN